MGQKPLDDGEKQHQNGAGGAQEPGVHAGEQQAEQEDKEQPKFGEDKEESTKDSDEKEVDAETEQLLGDLEKGLNAAEEPKEDISSKGAGYTFILNKLICETPPTSFWFSRSLGCKT